MIVIKIAVLHDIRLVSRRGVEAQTFGNTLCELRELCATHMYLPY
jgi:hypothetical protein